MTQKHLGTILTSTLRARQSKYHSPVELVGITLKPYEVTDTQKAEQNRESIQEGRSRK